MDVQPGPVPDMPQEQVPDVIQLQQQEQVPDIVQPKQQVPDVVLLQQQVPEVDQQQQPQFSGEQQPQQRKQGCDWRGREVAEGEKVQVCRDCSYQCKEGILVKKGCDLDRTGVRRKGFVRNHVRSCQPFPYAGCSFRGRSYVEGEFFKICDSCLYQCLGGKAKEVACRRGKKRQMVMAARKGNPGDAKKRKKKAKRKDAA